MASRLEDCKIHISRKIIDAMWALEHGAVEIALVIDDAKRLVGTLTDGDIRRAMLKGATLECPLAPHIQRAFTAVGLGTPRVEVLELMQARGINQIPVLDECNRVVSLHLLCEMLGCRMRDNWAVIMAGGKGQRLWPLTAQLPKPMIPVAGRPILERIVLHVMGFGFRRIFLSVNYMGSMIEKHFGDGSRFGIRIDYLRESRSLGTGGALSLLPEPPTAPVLVINGDLVTQADLGMITTYHDQGGYEATIGIRNYSHTVPYGCVEVARGRLCGFEEKPVMTRSVNTGIYVLNPAAISMIPREQEFPITALLENLLKEGKPVGSFEIEEDWIDVGLREQLHKVRNGDHAGVEVTH